jgi:hypothetical protein
MFTLADILAVELVFSLSDSERLSDDWLLQIMTANKMISEITETGDIALVVFLVFRACFRVSCSLKASSLDV